MRGMSSIETPTMVVSRRADGVIVGKERNFHLPRDPERVGAAMNAAWELAGHKPCAALWDMRGSPRPNAEAWQLFIHRIPDLFVALAIVADEEAVEVLGAFPATMDALLVPVRVFEDDEEASKWIGRYV